MSVCVLYLWLTSYICMGCCSRPREISWCREADVFHWICEKCRTADSRGGYLGDTSYLPWLKSACVHKPNFLNNFLSAFYVKYWKNKLCLMLSVLLGVRNCWDSMALSLFSVLIQVIWQYTSNTVLSQRVVPAKTMIYKLESDCCLLTCLVMKLSGNCTFEAQAFVA